MDQTYVKVELRRRTIRRNWSGFNDGKFEYVIKIPGFIGELKRRMTPKEADEFCKRNNLKAYKDAEYASQMGIYGKDSFKRGVKPSHPMIEAIGRAAIKPKKLENLVDDD